MEQKVEMILDALVLKYVEALKTFNYERERIAKEIMSEEGVECMSRFGVSYSLKIDALQKSCTEKDTLYNTIITFVQQLSGKISESKRQEILNKLYNNK